MPHVCVLANECCKYTSAGGHLEDVMIPSVQLLIHIQIEPGAWYLLFDSGTSRMKWD